MIVSELIEGLEAFESTDTVHIDQDRIVGPYWTMSLPTAPSVDKYIEDCYLIRNGVTP